MNKVRVRFAPSPTGYVHVGSLRTALYNYLFARHHGGDFIIRIEDTDQERLHEGAVENLLETLKWTGLDADEGPEKGGPRGPYYQSERLALYREHIDQLIENGTAYPCFCSSERLDKIRAEQQENKQEIKYDGHCRHISKDEAAKRIKNENYVVRMKVPADGETVVNDLVRGEVRFQNTLIDDQILLKSDGFPTYHLANVVDDHHMGITHVIRGEEWLPSTPKHVLLYEFFGWDLPQFAHLPLLLNPDRSKLSKRQGDVAVEDYRSKGYLPQALVNFVALLGWHPAGDEEVFELEKLIKEFSLERVTKAGAVFNLEKLNWMNGVYLRNIAESEYLSLVCSKMETLGYGARNETNEKIALGIRNSINTLQDVKNRAGLFFSDTISEYSADAREWLVKPESKPLFKSMINAITEVDEITMDSFKQIMKTAQQDSGLKGKDLWMPVRAAMTGLTEGPELPLVIEVLGKERMLAFLKQALTL